MTRIWPSSLRRVVQTVLTADWRSLAASILLAYSAGGCKFDVTPNTLAREADAGPAANWQPASVSRRNKIISQQIRDAGSDGSADAESSRNIITSADAGKRERDSGAAHKIMDAGQHTPRDSGPSASNMAGSPGTMGMPEMMKPDMPSQCMPGIYEGTFEGPVTFAVGSLNSVSGTVRAELVLDASGNSLQVRDGVMKGKDNAGIGMSSAWTGSVNCGTKQLENGRHESGAWDNGSTFTGTLDGSYSINPYAMSGTWKVQSQQIPLAGGNGTWNMTLRGSPTP